MVDLNKGVCRCTDNRCQIAMPEMADYYSLIAKAVAGLDPDSPGESRGTIYERARAAQLTELRRIKPPLTEAEIAHERLALEEAVRTVEGEAERRVRDPRSSNEISVEVPSMILTGSATGRLTRIWGLRIIFSSPSKPPK